MIEILKTLFDSLNKNGIDYCLYKSLCDFEEDSNGLRGDIDILVNQAHIRKFVKIVKESKFLTVKNPFLRNYYIGHDIHTNRSIILDVSTQIPAGVKPFKKYFLNINTSLLKKIIGPKDVKMLDWCDYIPLMFLLRIYARQIKKKDVFELETLLNNTDIKPGYLSSQVEELTGMGWHDVEDIIKSNRIYEKQNYLRKKTRKLLITATKFNLKSYLAYLYKIRYVFLKLLGRPQFLVKGRAPIIAIMGVDGAGKSSTIEYLKQSSFLKMTGVKFIYMGNNQYWMPGMKALIKLSKNNTLFKKLSIIFAFLDKRMRTLFIIYHSFMGNMVIADRYFYDEFVSRQLDQRVFGPIRKILHNIYEIIFNRFLFLHPDITVYLDVSPEVAFSRKQDYDFSKVEHMICAYRNYFDKLSRVTYISADDSHENVKRNVMGIVLKQRLRQETIR